MSGLHDKIPLSDPDWNSLQAKNTLSPMLPRGSSETDVETNVQVNVRMISGDHIETCKQVAIQAGIIKPDEAQKDLCVMTGE